MLFTMRETYVDRNPKSHKVLGIAPVAIIDCQLPFEYTITSRSTDVVVMALPVQNINHSSFRSMFEREKLYGNNFNDWFRQLKLVLRVEKKMFVIEQPLPAAPAADSNAQVLQEWNAIYDAYNEVACLILGSMTPELHRQFENSSPYDMIKELKSMFEKQAGVERFDLIQTFHACKQEEGKPVATYVLQMKEYVDQLEYLGYMLPQDLIVGLILNGLTKDFAGFVRNYNMHNMGKTIDELHAMLIEYEKGLPKKAETPQVMMIKGGKIQKANKKSFKAKGKGKTNGKGKDKQVYIPNPKNLKPSAKKHPTKDDTCHHCKEVGYWKMNYPVYLAELLKKKKQVVSSSSLEPRKLKQGALYLYVGNDVHAQVEAIRSYDLVLPNGLVICLDNCHYAPSITRGVVSVHRLVEYGFHCRLAHISTKHIEKMQQEGLLKSTDGELFDQCVSFLSGKITRKSFPHHPERATDLLGIIHTDLCSLLRHVSRQDASYFITFIDGYRRYGYVYLLKHKHKFKDYLKACGIVQQLTPPYTSQHNGVSERRNHTLLDMVRSMMNLTTLSLSFWDYALESATRILNMVSTKKVDKTPYELWYGKVPNLSYLKFEGFEPPQEDVIPVRRSERTHQAPDRLCLNVEAEEHSPGDMNEPTSYKVAMLDSESNKWIDAINAEIQSMMDNMVWVLVDLPPGSRLVAKGYTQLYEVDYEETFSHVDDIRAIRILISMAAFYDYEIWQIDVKNVFLNGYLDEDIYMVQLEGFVDPNHPRKASGSNVTFLILYVDDIIIMGNHITSLQSVKDYLGKCFAMKDLGEAAFILEIKIYRDMSKRLIGLGASTPKEVKSMQNVPYALAVGSIMYAWTGKAPSKVLLQCLQYIAASEAAMEAVWIRKFISGLGFMRKRTKEDARSRRSTKEDGLRLCDIFVAYELLDILQELQGEGCSNGNSLWEASVLLGRKKGYVIETLKFAAMPFGLTNAPTVFMELMSRWKSLEGEKRCCVNVSQQRGSGAKRKLSRCGRNQIGNEPILALPERADDFIVYYDARSKDLEACLEKGRR
ncbi:retrotransposon protein, putative, ty1-copia subclass [Tanacetum coccineum]